MSRAPAHSASVWLPAAVLVWCLSASALAQPAATADAEQLFNDGKALMAAGDHAQGCPLLAASYDADPATGALLALALCYEQAGKLESALRAYAQAADRSLAEENFERERAARDKVEELGGLRSTLTIELAGSAEGLVVRLDGAALAHDQLGAPLGLDGGTHVLEVSAPERQPFRTELQIAERGDAQRILVAALGPAPASAPPAAAYPSEHRVSRKWAPETWIGLATAGVGVVFLAIGTGLAVSGANGNQRAADGAGLAFALGGVLAATGGLVFAATYRPATADASTTAEVSAGAWILPGAGGVVAAGRF